VACRNRLPRPADAIADGTPVDLFGKAALGASWAHDEISDSMLNVSSIGLPIASFTVNGAAPRDLGW
jgi:hypothetical protein